MKEVDELVLLDIEASKPGRGPNFDLISSIANECFMPFAYGGGINQFRMLTNYFGWEPKKLLLVRHYLKIQT